MSDRGQTILYANKLSVARSPFPFELLPTELQINILTFLAPRVESNDDDDDDDDDDSTTTNLLIARRVSRHWFELIRSILNPYIFEELSLMPTIPLTILTTARHMNGVRARQLIAEMVSYKSWEKDDRFRGFFNVLHWIRKLTSKTKYCNADDTNPSCADRVLCDTNFRIWLHHFLSNPEKFSRIPYCITEKTLRCTMRWLAHLREQYRSVPTVMEEILDTTERHLSYLFVRRHQVKKFHFERTIARRFFQETSCT